MYNQKYTSANTSINSKKLPAIYKMVMDKILPEEKVIDYGCGKYFDNYNLPKNFFGYDPYNRPENEILNSHYDIALCSNVLNVIMEKEQRLEVLKSLRKLADKIYITVYEGDKSGNGKVSKNDCYQLNKRKEDYIPELFEVFENVKYNRKGYFECASEVI